MAKPYVGEIRIFAGNFAPAGWALCQGQLLPISDNDVLFNVIGTTYGGDGTSNFALPNLQGRAPVHMGNDFVAGQTGGTEAVALNVSQIPSHNHAILASTNQETSSNPSGNVTATSSSPQPYVADPPNTLMAAGALAPAGGSQPHDNMQPYLVMNYIISLFGMMPMP